MCKQEPENLNTWPEIESHYSSSNEVFDDMFGFNELSKLSMRPTVAFMPPALPGCFESLIDEDRQPNTPLIACQDKSASRALKKKINMRSAAHSYGVLRECQLPSEQELAFTLPDDILSFWAIFWLLIQI